QHIERPVALSKPPRRPVLDAGSVVMKELFPREVGHLEEGARGWALGLGARLGVRVSPLPALGASPRAKSPVKAFEKMGFSHPGWAIKKQWVEKCSRGPEHLLHCVEGQVIGCADDEILKGRLQRALRSSRAHPVHLQRVSL